MIALYTVIVFLLGLVSFLVHRRAKRLEKKFSKLAVNINKLAQPLQRQGNSSKADTCLMAKQQFELGRLVHQRDRLEGKYYRWQQLAEKFSRWTKTVRQWKGKKLPYTFGAVDVSLVLYGLDKLGLCHVNLTQLVQWLSSLNL